MEVGNIFICEETGDLLELDYINYSSTIPYNLIGEFFNITNNKTELHILESVKYRFRLASKEEKQHIYQLFK